MIPRRERGSVAVIAAISLVLITVIFFVTIQGYVQFRIRVIAQIRESYRIANILEQAAKTVAASWDNAQATGTPFTSITGGTTPSCAAACTAQTGVSPAICIDNVDVPSLPYCFYGATISATRMEFRVPLHLQFNEPSGITYISALKKRILSGMANVAFASRFDNVGGAPLNCSGGTPPAGCMRCGAGTGRMCVTIYGCPGSFPTCQGYTGGTAGASFVQNFYLVPAGGQE